MTDAEVFEKLKDWAKVFGYDILEVAFAEGDFPEGLEKGTRGFFAKGTLNSPGWIWLRPGLPIEEKVEVLAHEMGHMGLHLLGVEPYQKLSHEPTASLFAKCLVAVIREDFENPMFKIAGIYTLLKEFLELLKAKIDRTSKNLAMMEVAYLRWKKEVEGKGTTEGDRG